MESLSQVGTCHLKVQKGRSLLSASYATVSSMYPMETRHTTGLAHGQRLKDARGTTSITSLRVMLTPLLRNNDVTIYCDAQPFISNI